MPRRACIRTREFEPLSTRKLPSRSLNRQLSSPERLTAFVNREEVVTKSVFLGELNEHCGFWLTPGRCAGCVRDAGLVRGRSGPASCPQAMDCTRLTPSGP